MAEGFDQDQVPTARGRRNPEIEARLEAEDMLGEPGESAERSEIVALDTGDVIAAKITLEFETTVGSKAWSSFGIQTRIQPGEDEEDAFIRAASIVNTRAVDLAADIDERLSAYQQAQVAQQRQQRRIPSNNQRGDYS